MVRWVARRQVQVIWATQPEALLYHHRLFNQIVRLLAALVAPKRVRLGRAALAEKMAVLEPRQVVAVFQWAPGRKRARLLKKGKTRRQGRKPGR